VAEELRANGRDEVLFVGTPDGAEARLVPEAGVRFFGLSARGYDRARPLTLLTASATILVSTFRAFGLLRRETPDVVVGFGGYVSLPVGFAAVLRGLPLVLHEQNSVPGMANKVLSRWARSVAVTYAGSARYLHHPDRIAVTGNPVRRDMLDVSRARGRERLGIAPEHTVLLVFGGSQGARHINEAVVEGLQTMLSAPDVFVLHAAGEREIGSVEAATAGMAHLERYRVVPRIDDMSSAIAAADLIVCRAGATSIAEITAIGRPAVLVPYPYAADDHQTTNAQSVAEAGGAVVIADRDLDVPKFVEIVTGLLADEHRRATMSAASARLGRPDADARVAELVRAASQAEPDKKGTM